MSMIPDESDLHAYVDGRLDEARRSEVERWLQQHPERAREVRQWQQDAQRLRVLLAASPTLPDAPQLDPVAIRSRHAARRRRLLALAASLVLGIGAGGFTGWQARGMQEAARGEAPMSDALQAYRMFALQPEAVADMVQQQPGQMQSWLQRHFGDAAHLPDLHEAGFRPVNARLLATGSGPAAIVVYRNRGGDAISFYIRPPTALRGPLPPGTNRQDGLLAKYWSGQGYNYALVSRDRGRDAHVVERAWSARSI
ncbi:anti-sigma factor family protein [Oleiagrimonas soli]|uniref:Anti-sigma factor RsiW n=1 Tax=Oleiagrimonas soli TaxID=1543381 RepID=A0A099CWC1_9GAMM|nr:anti-sigma factor [Oleiagrimonas soli]KGI78283.1 transmembrane anti-sigma factor [Oleiagrimonas soli]MBB6183231.1 anti-sigma factor RsiW [Oleiagrimonas soli]